MLRHEAQLVKDLSERFLSVHVSDAIFQDTAKRINLAVFDQLKAIGQSDDQASRFSAGFSALLQSLAQAVLLSGAKEKLKFSARKAGTMCADLPFADIIPLVVSVSFECLNDCRDALVNEELSPTGNSGTLENVKTYAVCLWLIAREFDEDNILAKKCKHDFEVVQRELTAWFENSWVNHTRHGVSHG